MSVVALLLLNGADTTVKNSFNLTPREEARGTVRDFEIFELISAGRFFISVTGSRGCARDIKSAPTIVTTNGNVTPT